MKAKKNLILGSAIGGSLIVGLVAGRFLFAGEPPAAEHEHDAAEVVAAESAEATIWTCSMHPQIRQSEPGDCPICGMDLIPLEEDGGGAEQGPRTLSMSEASRALAEIQTTTVERRYPEAQVRIVGTLDYDETRERSLSARFPARIDDLYVNFTGIQVERGEHLAEVYSPELLTAQRELLSSYRNDPDSSITAGTREKLRLWDLLPEQIESIIERGEPRDRFVLRAPTSGVVVSKDVQEGDYVQTGQPLFKIVDLSQLWLNLEAFESNLPWLRYGQEVEFTVEAYPGETFTGQIAFIEPEFNRRTRTVPVRVNVPNEDRRLKPGMFARGIVDVRIAEEGRVYAPELAGKWISPMHPEVVKDHPGQCDVCGMDLVPVEDLGYEVAEELNAPIVVPTSAVLRTGKRAVVYVQVPNAERPSYEGREIVLGPRAGDVFVVEAGLEPGDEVVTNGAFKIDSALQIQAKPSMMNPEGGGSGGGHDHGETSATGQADEHAGHDMSFMIEAETAQAILPSYLSLQDALAADDLDAAKQALKEMMAETGHSGPLPDLIHRMIGGENLEELRSPHFEKLSMALIQAVEANPAAFEGSLYRMHCPMAAAGEGADWIQDEDNLRNPYYGADMLTCGEVRESWGDTSHPDNTDG